MRKVLLLIMMLGILALPVAASEQTAPEVPKSGESYMPEDPQSFAEGLWYILSRVLQQIKPNILKAVGLCVSLVAASLLTGTFHSFHGGASKTAQLIGTIFVGVILLSPSGTLIHLGVNTVSVLSEYGKLLLPVMTTALAAQGGVSTSAALYAGTTVLCTVLTNFATKFIVPMLYIYLGVSIASCALEESMLGNLKKFVSWAISWSMKGILYIFTGFLGITGVVSGGVDAAAVKATKLAISGSVPVVGGILSDASEAVLVSAGIMKGAAGTYGILAMLAVFAEPFVRIGMQYLLLKLTASVCDLFAPKGASSLIHDYSGAMGMVLLLIRKLPTETEAT